MSSSSTHRMTALCTACCSPGRFTNLQEFGRHGGLTGGAKVRVGQKDMEAGDVFVVPANTSEDDASAVFLDDALADPQAESSALCRLGGEEGFEEVPGVLGIDADSGIANGDAGSGLTVLAAHGVEDM